jgi:DNA-binding XRE family transcriptional regulator
LEKTFKTALDKALVNEGRTNKWLATQLSVTHESVSIWRNGRYSPSDRNKIKIAKLLGVSVQELFYEEATK